MRKITYTFLAFMLVTSLHLYSQSEMDALKFSRSGLYGTARSMGMGGAFGALGGDMTGVSINPAGIGVYRSSEIAGTFGLQSNNSKVGDIKNRANDFNMHNFGFVGYFPLRNETMPLINFGFAHNRHNSFNKTVGAAGSGVGTMMDYMAERSSGVDREKLFMGKDLPDPFLSQDWLSVLGFNSWLIDGKKNADGKYVYSPLNTNGDNPFQEIKTYERGYIDNYDFTIGTTISDVLNIGVSLNLTDLYHYIDTEFLEDFDDGTKIKGGYTLGNNVITKGSGIGAKLGLIYRPIHELRLGVAYHTPVVYSLTESYDAYLDDDMGAYIADPDYEKGVTSSARFPNYYDLRTPSKWVFSAASVLGSNFILSADYELTDYRNMKLKVPAGASNQSFYDYDNQYISEDFKVTSTLRLGAEYRFNQQLSARLGYAWMQNPFNSDFVSDGNPGVSGSNTIFRIEGDSNYYTAGLGYRFTKEFYIDLAMVYQTQKDDLYPFPNVYNDAGNLSIDAAPFELKNNSVRGIITLGYKF